MALFGICSETRDYYQRSVDFQSAPRQPISIELLIKHKNRLHFQSIFQRKSSTDREWWCSNSSNEILHCHRLHGSWLPANGRKRLLTDVWTRWATNGVNHSFALYTSLCLISYSRRVVQHTIIFLFRFFSSFFGYSCLPRIKRSTVPLNPQIKNILRIVHFFSNLLAKQPFHYYVYDSGHNLG